MSSNEKDQHDIDLEIINSLQKKNDKLSADNIELKLKARKKAKKVLYMVIPVLGVISYLLGVASYQIQTQNWITWIPGN